MRKSLRIQTVFCTNFFSFVQILRKYRELFIRASRSESSNKSSFFFFTPQRLLFFTAVKGVKGKKGNFYFIAIGVSSSLIVSCLEPPLARPSIPLGEASFT